MAENVTLARPYAEAAFQAARESNSLTEWAEALQRMAGVATNEEMRALISNPNVDAATSTGIFLDAVGSAVSNEQRKFVNLLAENNRMAVLPEISDLFAGLKNDVEGVKNAHIASAFALEGVQLTNLLGDLERRFGCKINATVEILPELIGGVRISVGDQVIDASIRGKLAQMASALKN